VKKWSTAQRFPQRRGVKGVFALSYETRINLAKKDAFFRTLTKNNKDQPRTPTGFRTNFATRSWIWGISECHQLPHFVHFEMMKTDRCARTFESRYLDRKAVWTSLSRKDSTYVEMHFLS
jgi:hypothetical protein